MATASEQRTLAERADRLRRIAELTALDLRTAEAVQLLGAALLARRQADKAHPPGL